MTDIDMERAMLSIAAPREMSSKPYLIGAGIGVLSWVVFAVVAAPIGIYCPGTGLAAVATGSVHALVAPSACWPARSATPSRLRG